MSATLDAYEARLALASAARSWVAGPFPSMTCAEAESLADALRFLDEPELATELIEAHAGTDEPGDLHHEDEPTTTKPTLASIKRSFEAGQRYRVTNHYITKPDHVCYGTQERTVLKATTAGLTLSLDNHPDEYHRANGSHVDWPKAADAERDDDGTVRFYWNRGNGRELFLTFEHIT